MFAASRAPSGSNRQLFRFVLLRDDETSRQAKALIGGVARQAWDAKRAHDGYDRGSGGDTESPKARTARAMQHFVDHYEEIPVNVLACLIRHRAPNPSEGPASTRPARTRCWRPAPRLRRRHHGLARRRRAPAARAARHPRRRRRLGLHPLGRPVGGHAPCAAAR
jgi:nitroreductase